MITALGIDLGFRNLAISDIEWSQKVKRCRNSWLIQTSKDQPDNESWECLLNGIAVVIAENVGVNFVALEDVSGVRHGKDNRGQSGAQADPLLQLQGAIRMACRIYGVELRIVRTVSVYSALGCQVPQIPGESEEQKKKRQKLATQATVQRLLKGTECCSFPDGFDACAHAISCCLGRGVVA